MIIATCGHEIIENYGITAIKGYSKDGSHVIDFPVLCKKCLESYKKIGLILETEAEQNEWLRSCKNYGK